MPRWLLILLLSWVYTGCAARPTRLPETVAHGAILRLATDPATQAVLLRSAVARPLVAVGLGPSLSTAHRRLGARSCARFVFDGDLAFPDGTPVRPQDVIDAWERGLADPLAANRWLLAPVLGHATAVEATAAIRQRLRARDDALEICPARPTPDLSSRLAHPDLWPWRKTATGAGWEGPGAFSGAADGLEANPYFPGGGPKVERVELVESGDPGRLLEQGQADLAVVYGTAAAALLDEPRARVRLARLPGWDRSYALWLNDRARWINDPRFRRWLAGVVDRQAMLDFLFDGRGEPVFRLLPEEGGTSEWEVVGRRPLDEPARPQLSLLVDSGDANAGTIARRIKAVLEQQGTEVTIEPRAQLQPELAGGRYQLVLLAHQPPVDDPVLGLLHTLWPLGEAAKDALESLDRASLHEDRERRAQAARLAESELLRDARLVPLIRLHSWLATRTGLAGVRAGPSGILSLDRAEWVR